MKVFEREETAIATLKKGEGRFLKAGGMWIYDNEIAGIRGTYENGEIVRVEDFDGYPLGKGYINDRSRIRIRMMTRKKDTIIDEVFLQERLRSAWEYRKAVTDLSSCRLVFGEADFLPGLVIDKFSDVLVVESLALGIDRMKEEILRILQDILKEDGITIRGIYERSDAKVRLQEGMERKTGFLSQPFDTKVPIVENGVKYLVDVAEGQKTGFFLDQKYNRLAIHPSLPGRKGAGLLYAYRFFRSQRGNCRSQGSPGRGRFRAGLRAGQGERPSEWSGRPGEISVRGRL